MVWAAVFFFNYLFKREKEMYTDFPKCVLKCGAEPSGSQEGAQNAILVSQDGGKDPTIGVILLPPTMYMRGART